MIDRIIIIRHEMPKLVGALIGAAAGTVCGILSSTIMLTLGVSNLVVIPLGGIASIIYGKAAAVQYIAESEQRAHTKNRQRQIQKEWAEKYLPRDP